ncbi:MAG: NAD-dependent epimerase/dehydratase family protein [bacterium]
MILVTGGTGFLGKKLVQKLLETNQEKIRCFVRPGTGLNSILTNNAITSNIKDRLEIFPASFNDKKALEDALKGIKIVYHLAASKTGSVASMFANTVVSSDNLYQACINASISRFVLVSSFSVIGTANLARNTVVDENVSMDEHPEWRDPYSFSKHYQESLAWEYFNNGLPLVVIRPGVIFGPESEILSARVGLRSFGFFLYLGQNNIIPLTYVDNCADAIILAGTVPKIEGEIFCIVDDDLPTCRYLLKRYKREVEDLRVISIPYNILKLIALYNVWYTNRTKGHLPAIFTPYKVKSIWKSYKYTNRKSKEILGWNPKISMEEALNITFSYLSNSTAKDKE